MRNYFAFYSPTYLPTYLLLFVALSLMWSCEQEAALQDFEAVPDEMEIAAKKAPPIYEGPNPIATCDGCRLTITSANISGATIEVQSILAAGPLEFAQTAYVCNSNVLWLSGTVNTANLPASIEFAEDMQIDLKKLQFRARTFSGIPAISFSYQIRCSGVSSFGEITSDPNTWVIGVDDHDNTNPSENPQALALLGWGDRFPSSPFGQPAHPNINRYYSCPLAAYCGIGGGPLEP